MIPKSVWFVCDYTYFFRTGTKLQRLLGYGGEYNCHNVRLFPNE